MALLNGPDTANIVSITSAPDGSDVIVYQSNQLLSSPTVYAVKVAAPHWHPIPAKPKPDLSIHPKLRGSLRNTACPKCGRKLKRCGHAPARSPSPSPRGDSPTPAAPAGGGTR
jgi:hypothetical protein